MRLSSTYDGLIQSLFKEASGLADWLDFLLTILIVKEYPLHMMMMIPCPAIVILAVLLKIHIRKKSSPLLLRNTQ